MKKRRIILSVLSALLVIILLIGSTGFTIVIQRCKSCGISINSSLFTSISVTEDTCCGISDAQCSSETTETFEKGCCTFTTEKLKLTDYIPSEPVTFSFTADILPAYFLPVAPRIQEKHILPLFIHNKHGGRDVMISNCQFLI